jgi:hypothetical protein
LTRPEGQRRRRRQHHRRCGEQRQQPEVPHLLAAVAIDQAVILNAGLSGLIDSDRWRLTV